jgi:DNA invertase Pin-like site-specific DNA recombinase
VDLGVARDAVRVTSPAAVSTRSGPVRSSRTFPVEVLNRHSPSRPVPLRSAQASVGAVSFEPSAYPSHCRGLSVRFRAVTATLIGYARCSTDQQDLAAQRRLLLDLGVPAERIYLDRGLTGTNRRRPGLDQALAAVRGGDTLVVPKLDRLARSVPDARDIGDSLVARGVRLSLGGAIYDPADPMGKMFFNILATFAEFEVDLLRMRTREGMAIARAKGRLKGKPPKLSARQQQHLVDLHDAGEHSIADLAELFSVSRATVYRVLERGRTADPGSAA